jgi:hypothetical protein
MDARGHDSRPDLLSPPIERTATAQAHERAMPPHSPTAQDTDAFASITRNQLAGLNH